MLELSTQARRSGNKIVDNHQPKSLSAVAGPTPSSEQSEYNSSSIETVLGETLEKGTSELFGSILFYLLETAQKNSSGCNKALEALQWLMKSESAGFAKINLSNKTITEWNAIQDFKDSGDGEQGTLSDLHREIIQNQLEWKAEGKLGKIAYQEQIRTFTVCLNESVGLLWWVKLGGTWTQELESRFSLLGKILVLAEREKDQSAAITRSQKRFQQNLTNSRMEDTANLAARIAHDLDNLWTGLLGFTELIQLTPAGKSAGNYLSELTQIGNRGIHLTQRLHQIKRLGCRSFGATNLVKALGDQFHSYPQEIKDQIQCHLKIHPNCVMVAMDHPTLRHLLGELMDNALESLMYSHEAALKNPAAFRKEDITLKPKILRISADPIVIGEEDAQAYYADPNAGEWIELKIQDNGFGMKPDTIATLFKQPIFTTKLRHLGMGLTIVFRILRAHGAGIKIDSQYGHGTCVTVLLPPTSLEQTTNSPLLSVDIPAVNSTDNVLR